MSSKINAEQSLPKLGMKGATRCAICNVETALKCQGCVQRGASEIRFYCGKEHQAIDWKNGHKHVCYVKKVNLIYQFKITLIGVEKPFVGDVIQPPIWRRIQMRKDSTFRQLHKAISISMGWFESHLHEFRMECGRIIGMPNDDDFGIKTIPEKTVKLETHFKKLGNRCVYEYDFGDSWVHEILLENICPMDQNTQYPICIDGARACPPEGESFYSHHNVVTHL